MGQGKGTRLWDRERGLDYGTGKGGNEKSLWVKMRKQEREP